MSIRNIRKLKITNENKDDIQAAIENKPEMHRLLDSLVYLYKNPFVYHDGMKDLNYYEIYKFIQYKIFEIINPFLDDDYLRIEHEEDLYYELRFSEGLNKNSNLIKEMAKYYGESSEEFLERE